MSEASPTLGAVLTILERIAEHGTAPSDGCHLFGVGFEDAFDRLTKVYLEERVGTRGGSAEKFVVGPYGSGKTHFVRELMERARALGFVTVETALTKDLDATDNLLVYKEVARNIRAPATPAKGIEGLLGAVVERVTDSVGGADEPGGPVDMWIDALSTAPLESMKMRTVLVRALKYQRSGNQEARQQAIRWLSGDVDDRRLASDLGVAAVTKQERNLFGRDAFLSLCQFIRRAQIPGTVVAFDEAEQGLNVQRARRAKVMSLLQSQINAVADVNDAALFLVYAVTDDVIEAMEDLAALQQRVADPAPGYGFFDGNTYAPKITLEFRGQVEPALIQMGERLADMYLGSVNEVEGPTEKAIRVKLEALATETAQQEATSGARRIMAKKAAACLLFVHGGRDPTDFVAPAVPQRDDEF